MNRIDELKEGLKSLDIAPTEEQLAHIGAYIDELLFWNKKFNLVKSDEEELIGRHILDALAPPASHRGAPPTGRGIGRCRIGSGPARNPSGDLLGHELVGPDWSVPASGPAFWRSAVVAAGLQERAEVLHADVRGLRG